MNDVVQVRDGAGPLILSMPHVGLDVPEDIRAALNETGLELSDTDWRIDELYDFAGRFDPTIVEANVSRYVIDVNRDPSGASLYPGQATTGLVPLTTFDGDPIWRTEPDKAEIIRRTRLYFKPYHGALIAAVERLQADHEHLLLYDCHSIRSTIPRLFDGELPVLNMGFNSGSSAGTRVRRAAADVARESGFSCAIDGRFKGGWITRAYARPEEGLHTMQMEIAQRAYLVEEAAPWSFDEEKAASLQTTLEELIAACLDAMRNI